MEVHQRNADGNYGPTTKNKFYQSKPDHRNTATRRIGKTKWCIVEGQEFSVFLLAESPEREWYCNENLCYFSLVENCSVLLGSTGERLAKFPKPTNDTDPWHGYPVTCSAIENTPSDDLLDLLVDTGIIDNTTRSRIERKKI